jgi:3-hydroxybutyryl-CoA dehydrogenase
MTVTERATIAVVGAGLMGHGIAQVFAKGGHKVRVYDAHQAALDSLHARIAANLESLGQSNDIAHLITAHSDLGDAVASAGIIIEAALEKLDLKQAIFADLVRLARRDALIASNTSVIPITSIVGDLPTADRILGTHWWNPPFLVPLVEVVGTAQTSDAAIETMIALLTSVGKTPVRLMKDVPGFVGNRLQHALWREAIAIVEEGIADAETVDTVVKSSFGRRLAVLGPMENADLVGTDLTLDIHNVVLQHLDRSPQPQTYLRKLVADGKLGMKTGQGFRTWSEETKSALRKRVFNHLKDFRQN